MEFLVVILGEHAGRVRWVISLVEACFAHAISLLGRVLTPRSGQPTSQVTTGGGAGRATQLAQTECHAYVVLMPDEHRDVG